MVDAHRQSTRLMVDLQACQTPGSAQRGVGRYSSALVSSIAAACAPRDLRAIVSQTLPHRVGSVGISADRIVTLPPLPDWNAERDFLGGERDTLDSLTYTSLLQRYKPDIVHVSHVFEGWGERVPLPDPVTRAPGQILSATLYDLIPLLFQEHYFALPQFKPWYQARMKWLRQADLLLAISESTRQDAISHLGLEPWRVVTVHGGIGEHFCPPEDRDCALRLLRSKYAIRNRFALYTGGDDFRKNLEGAVEGFAAVAPALRDELQLVIVCSMADERKRHFERIGQAHGLGPGQLLITGFVPEEDLVALYGACELFVFPSLYEGLGLPVLEAMACGAPAIGGNNSSIREIIARDDALFDAHSAESIAGCITRVLTSPAFADDLRQHGLGRARAFTWPDTASRAIAALDEALARARTKGVAAASQGWLPRRRLAVLSPLPPLRSGIADYNAAFLPHLARHFDIDLYVDGYIVEDDELNAAFRIYDVADFEAVAPSYDAILYEFGNSRFHDHMLRLIERFPGIVGLHDAYLSGLVFYAAMVQQRPDDYRARMLAAHGPRARRVLAPAFGVLDPDHVALVELPCTKGVIDRATGLISHSPFNLSLAREHYPQGWCAPYRTIPQMVASPPPLSPAERARVRSRLGYQVGDFVIASFGYVAWTKWGDRLLEAFLAARLRDERTVHLAFVGELENDAFGESLRRGIEEARLGDRIRITGYLDEEAYQEYLLAADLAVQLRTKSRGGTPKGVLDCLARGVPVVVNNDASYTDYPPDAVVKLSASPAIAEIAGVLDRAYREPAWRHAFAQAGLNYVATHHSPAACAAEYAAAIGEFIARHDLASSSPWTDAMAPRLAGCADPEAAIASGAGWLRALPSPAFERRRLYVDVGDAAKSDHQTGAATLVKEIVRHLYGTARAGVEPVAVELRDGGLHVARDWLSTQGLLLAHERANDGAPIDFRPGDVLLMLDSPGSRHGDFFTVFEKARSVNTAIITAICDLLPITPPPGDAAEGAGGWFDRWLKDAIASNDGLICVSESVADDLIAYVRRNGLEREGLKIACWRLGADANRDSPGDERPAGDEGGSLPGARTMPPLTWAQSAEMLLGLIFDEMWLSTGR